MVMMAMASLLHQLPPVLCTASAKCSLKVAATGLNLVIFLEDPKNISACLSCSRCLQEAAYRCSPKVRYIWWNMSTDC